MVILISCCVMSSTLASVKSQSLSDCGCYVAPQLNGTEGYRIDSLICKSFFDADSIVEVRKCEYASGAIASCQTLIDGFAFGHYMSYYQNGNIRVASMFVNDCVVGSYSEYYEDGSLCVTGRYFFDSSFDRSSYHLESIDSLQTVDSTGDVETSLTIDSCYSLKDGLWTYYAPTGLVVRKEVWKRGLFVR